MRNFLLGISFVVVIAGIAFAAYQYGKTRGAKLPGESAITPTLTQETTAPTLAATETPTTSVLPSMETQSDADLIRAALFAKNNWPANDALKVTVSTNDGTYASGTAGGQGGGGYFFAKKVNGVWVIVADGNGVITCAELAPYPDYPKSLISECYDEATQKNVQR